MMLPDLADLENAAGTVYTAGLSISAVWRWSGLRWR